MSESSTAAHRVAGSATSRVRTGAQIMCEALIRQGVDTIFGIPGGAIMPFYHALPEYGSLRHVLCRHEQGAGHAAEGYARASGRVGVCVATSGPGATNLVTPIADAWMDSTPLVAITGQVPHPMIGTDGFQEVDIIGIATPITKQTYLVDRAADLPRVFAEAFHLASSGRPGPVLIDVTKDAQQMTVTPNWEIAYALPGYVDRRAEPIDLAHIHDAAGLLGAAERPLIVAGNGVIQSNAVAELLELAERTGTPVVTTLLGLGAFPQHHPLSLGMPGMHGWVHVNRAIQRCDLLLAVGMRFDDRVTGRPSGFAPRAKVVHIDVEPAELGKNVRADIGVVGDARRVLRALCALAPEREHATWVAEIRALQETHEPRATYRRRQPACDLAPHDLFDALHKTFANRTDLRVVTDVGQHQMWAAQLLPWTRPRTHITSGGAGTMGFALPAALGVALAAPNETVWAIVGDGGFQMTNQELTTVVQENIRNLKVAIVNNGYLGMVRQWQQLFGERRYSETRLLSPEFARLAEAHGVRAFTVERREDVASTIAAAEAHDGPTLIDFRVEREANVFPIVPQGRAIGEMLLDADGEICTAGERA